ncbi:5-formyltetrahydrofolate cyclo-ligase [Butyrivibrio sp. MC2021]|uniref:5-formyltetrahydrofolate cyclo-ligase n=1 Tax=Butyrivibrio sp. MC2021 TaxID=1408306 RepID=UPI00056B56A5|nr:5-formyltetrahydrofolate cyclo-ligase [Butyrivibrio sp. MC2021]
MNKAEIRNNILGRRDAQASFEIAEKSRIIFDKLTGLEDYKEAENLLVYASMRSEVRTDEIILDALADGKKVFCPKVTDKNNGKMSFVRIFALEDLKEGYYGIREPELNDLSETYFSEADRNSMNGNTLAIVPGVAFDKNKNRIGYNGGFYDRFLSSHKNVKSVGLCYRLQVVDDNLPVESHDMPLDRIITD